MRQTECPVCKDHFGPLDEEQVIACAHYNGDGVVFIQDKRATTDDFVIQWWDHGDDQDASYLESNIPWSGSDPREAARQWEQAVELLRSGKHVKSTLKEQKA